MPLRAGSRLARSSRQAITCALVAMRNSAGVAMPVNCRRSRRPGGWPGWRTTRFRAGRRPGAGTQEPAGLGVRAAQQESTFAPWSSPQGHQPLNASNHVLVVSKEGKHEHDGRQPDPFWPPVQGNVDRQLESAARIELGWVSHLVISLGVLMTRSSFSEAAVTKVNQFTAAPAFRRSLYY